MRHTCEYLLLGSRFLRALALAMWMGGFAECMACSDVSRHSEISIQCYLRTEEPKRGGDGIADDMGNDIFMGGVRFTPDFDDSSSQDQWYDLVGGSGKIQIGVAFKPSTVCLRNLRGFLRIFKSSVPGPISHHRRL